MVWSHSKSTFVFFSVLALCLPLCASAETILLDFHSPMCGPCRQMRPVIRQLAAQGYQVRGVDISRESQLAAQYGVTQVPTFIVLVDGRESGRVVGLARQQQLEQMLGPRNTGSHAGTVAPVADSTFATPQPPRNQDVPQAGRIVSLPDSSHTLASTQAQGNPFSHRQLGPAPTSAGSQQNQRLLIEATVKITVDDPQGKSVGTGTIVDARSGEALVLTCGHLFRTSAGQGPIQLTLFQMTPNGVQAGSSYQGRLIEYDLERDLGLISFKPAVPVQAVPISSGAGRIPVGTSVTSVGCNAGNDPTARVSRVTAFDRYNGPSNIEVAGAPVEGRSGGGLFNNAGELIGVCFAADNQDNEGLYASLLSIRTKLDDLGLQMIYQSPQAGGAKTQPRLARESRPMPMPEMEPDFAVRGQEPVPARSANPGILQTQLDAEEKAALAEIRRRGADSEVICIIRPHDPTAKSELITLNNASPEFVRQLSEPPSGAGHQNAPASAAANRLIR